MGHIIVIKLKDTKERNFEIKININQTIGEIKKKYNMMDFEWLYDGIILENDKTFKYYKIKDGDEIYCIVNVEGGGGIFGIETIDISKNYGTNNMDFSSSAPSYRLIVSGLNIQSICKNNKICIANEKIIYVQIGFVTNWNLLLHQNEVICPECKRRVKPLNFGFLNCKYEIEYEKLEDDEYNDGKVKGKADSKEFIIFDQYYSGKAIFKKLIFNILHLFQ